MRPAHAPYCVVLQRAAHARHTWAAQHFAYVCVCGCSVVHGQSARFHVDGSLRRTLTWQRASPGAQYMWGRPISGVQTPQVLLQHAMAASAPRGAAPPLPAAGKPTCAVIRFGRVPWGPPTSSPATRARARPAGCCSVTAYVPCRASASHMCRAASASHCTVVRSALTRCGAPGPPGGEEHGAVLLGWGPGGQQRPLSLHPAQDVMAGLPAYDDMQARSWAGTTSPSCGLVSDCDCFERQR
jgi:hypothetical protein